MAKNFTKFGFGIVGSHENKLPTNGVAPRAAVFQEGNLQTSYRFLLNIRGVDVAYIVNTTRPSYTVQTQDAKLLNWTFSYPTNIVWDPINFSVRELFEGYTFTSILGLFYGKLVDYGWDPPNKLTEVSPVLGEQNLIFSKDLSKLSLRESLGPVIIKSINDGGETVEEWTLHGAFVTAVKPSNLSYEQESLTSVDVTLKYDFATLEVKDSTGVYTAAAALEAQSF